MSDSDDNIFDTRPTKAQGSRRPLVQTEIIEEKQEVQVEVEEVDTEALMRRRRMARQAQQETQIIENTPNDLQQKEKKELEKREKKKKKKEKRKEKLEIKQAEIQNKIEPDEEDNIFDEGEEEIEGKKVELLKPIFVSKKERDVNLEALEEEKRLRREKEKNIERKNIESKMLLIQSQQQEMIADESDEDGKIPMPNDEDDETQDANEYALWKIRELRRLKRDYDERMQIQREKAEIERRRNLTDEQRIEEDFKLGSDKTRIKEKAKQVFMQKYYHQGVFFQDDKDEIFNRDYNLPVGEDLWDKSHLPEILQKRRGQFGKKGNSKYTHLTAEDTTNYDPEYQVDEQIRMKYFMKQAGNNYQNVFDSKYGRRR